jgi:hypothetical protein
VCVCEREREREATPTSGSVCIPVYARHDLCMHKPLCVCLPVCVLPLCGRPWYLSLSAHASVPLSLCVWACASVPYLLLQLEHLLVEELLKPLIAVINTQLSETIHGTHQVRQSVSPSCLADPAYFFACTQSTGARVRMHVLCRCGCVSATT